MDGMHNERPLSQFPSQGDCAHSFIVTIGGIGARSQCSWQPVSCRAMTRHGTVASFHAGTDVSMRMLIAALILPLLAVWLWWPVAASRPAQRWRRVLATLALALALPTVMLLWQADVLAYATISRLQVAAGGVLLTGLLLLVFAILRDLGFGLHALAERVLRRAPGSGLRRWHAPWLTFSAVAVAGMLSLLGLYNGLKVPPVVERELPVAGLPAQWDGLRVAVLTDLHITPAKGRGRTEAIVARTLAAAPDLIVLPGDMVDGAVSDSADMVAPLAALRAPLGVWVAPGNHEVYFGYRQWMDYLQSLGLNLLENGSTLIERDGAVLALSGLGDLAAENGRGRQEGAVPPDLAATLAGTEPADFHLMLVHQPKLARRVAATGRVDLQISGHTHGGHLTGFDRWVVAPANDGFVRGRYDVGPMALYVATGAGQWDGFTARLGVPSAIDVLVLRTARAAGGQ